MKKLFKKIGAGFAAASGASLMTAAVVAMMGCTDNGGNVANGVSEETSVALRYTLMLLLELPRRKIQRWLKFPVYPLFLKQ